MVSMIEFFILYTIPTQPVKVVYVTVKRGQYRMVLFSMPSCIARQWLDWVRVVYTAPYL
eukprot:COSAG02_NODE_1565_length_11911_cov_10.325940_3_plen_59_part_00